MFNASAREQFKSYPNPSKGDPVVLGALTRTLEGDAVVGNDAHLGRLYSVIKHLGGSIFKLLNDETDQVRIASLARPGTVWIVDNTTYRID